MDDDLADRLDRSIGPAPDSDDLLAGLLAAGHGAVRRRRVLWVAGAAAAVLVVAGGVGVATSGGPDRALAPAGAPSSTPTISPTTSTATPPALPPPATATSAPETAGANWPGWPDGELATFDARSGKVAIHPG